MIEEKEIRYFKSLVGEENVYSDKAHLIAYSYDATRTRFEPDAVIFPRSEEDVSKILSYCNERSIIIVPRGAGSGFTGGALPSSGGIVLAMEKHMNKILEIDMANMVAVVQPGVINMDLQKAVEEVGLFYPPDPASQDYSTIGGNVNENAGGMRAAKYGITKDYVMAIRAVLPNGDIIKAFVFPINGFHHRSYQYSFGKDRGISACYHCISFINTFILHCMVEGHWDACRSCISILIHNSGCFIHRKFKYVHYVSNHIPVYLGKYNMV